MARKRNLIDDRYPRGIANLALIGQTFHRYTGIARPTTLFWRRGWRTANGVFGHGVFSCQSTRDAVTGSPHDQYERDNNGGKLARSGHSDSILHRTDRRLTPARLCATTDSAQGRSPSRPMGCTGSVGVGEPPTGPFCVTAKKLYVTSIRAYIEIGLGLTRASVKETTSKESRNCPRRTQQLPLNLIQNLDLN